MPIVWTARALTIQYAIQQLVESAAPGGSRYPEEAATEIMELFTCEFGVDYTQPTKGEPSCPTPSPK